MRKQETQATLPVPTHCASLWKELVPKQKPDSIIPNLVFHFTGLLLCVITGSMSKTEKPQAGHPATPVGATSSIFQRYVPLAQDKGQQHPFSNAHMKIGTVTAPPRHVIQSHTRIRYPAVHHFPAPDLQPRPLMLVSRWSTMAPAWSKQQDHPSWFPMAAVPQTIDRRLIWAPFSPRSPKGSRGNLVYTQYNLDKCGYQIPTIYCRTERVTLTLQNPMHRDYIFQDWTSLDGHTKTQQGGSMKISWRYDAITLLPLIRNRRSTTSRLCDIILVIRLPDERWSWAPFENRTTQHPFDAYNFSPSQGLPEFAGGGWKPWCSRKEPVEPKPCKHRSTQLRCGWGFSTKQFLLIRLQQCHCAIFGTVQRFIPSTWCTAQIESNGSPSDSIHLAERAMACFTQTLMPAHITLNFSRCTQWLSGTCRQYITSHTIPAVSLGNWMQSLKHKDASSSWRNPLPEFFGTLLGKEISRPVADNFAPGSNTFGQVQSALSKTHPCHDRFKVCYLRSQPSSDILINNGTSAISFHEPHWAMIQCGDGWSGYPPGIRPQDLPMSKVRPSKHTMSQGPMKATVLKPWSPQTSYYRT